MLPIEGVISRFFFKAMVAGWAAGGEKIKIAEMPGHKAISFRQNNFYLLDRWCVNSHSKKSAGTTTIWDEYLKDVPMWVMNYGGFYEERAIPFVKRALQQAYGANKFIGGRGPYVYSEGSLVYVNQPHPDSHFLRFEGREEVFDTQKTSSCDIGYYVDGISLGFHEYWGMGLF